MTRLRLGRGHLKRKQRIATLRLRLGRRSSQNSDGHVKTGGRKTRSKPCAIDLIERPFRFSFSFSFVVSFTG